ncbi:MAG: transposase, partial [Planctomycetaceae bacterium]
MSESTTDIRIVPLPTGRDVITEILRDGARRMLAEAIEAKVAAWIDAHDHLKDRAGRQQVVRNGHLPERTIQTGIGEIPVKQPRVHDRRPPEQREKFTPAGLPPYLRRTKSLAELIPWLYLKGLSTGDFSEALRALLGPDAPNLSATTVTRLKAVWEQDHEAWSRRSLVGKHYVYVWADGVHFNIRLEEGRQCILVLMGATTEGKKELIAIADGYRESEQSWKELLLDCKA